MTAPIDDDGMRGGSSGAPVDWSNPQPGQQYPAAPQWGGPGRQYDSPGPAAMTGQAVPAQPRSRERPWPTPGPQTVEQPVIALSGLPSRAAWKPILLGVGVVAAVVALVVPMGSLLNGKTLDRNAAQQGVKHILTGSYGVPNVGDVACPSGIEVKVDSTFTCTAQIDGGPRPITARFVSSDGTYEVNRP
jgi:hypothetical protein